MTDELDGKIAEERRRLDVPTKIRHVRPVPNKRTMQAVLSDSMVALARSLVETCALLRELLVRVAAAPPQIVSPAGTPAPAAYAAPISVTQPPITLPTCQAIVAELERLTKTNDRATWIAALQATAGVASTPQLGTEQAGQQYLMRLKTEGIVGAGKNWVWSQAKPTI